jgi:hypothetical protein
MLTGRSGTDAIALVVASLAVLGAGMHYALSVHRRTSASGRRLFIQHWHLEQLLPHGTVSP